MKHLLNNISEEEKNRIREQHEGGMKLSIDNFKSLVETKSGSAKPFINEQSMETCEQCGGEMREGNCMEQCGSMSEEELDEQGGIKSVVSGVKNAGKGIKNDFKFGRAKSKVKSINDNINRFIQKQLNNLKNDKNIPNHYGGYIENINKIAQEVGTYSKELDSVSNKNRVNEQNDMEQTLTITPEQMKMLHDKGECKCGDTTLKFPSYKD